jgi:xanthine dehydrogenase accessory factor
MKKVIPGIRDALRRGERVALSLVVDSSGSTPRKSGSLMASLSDGKSFGTVGGGAVEYEAQRVAGEALRGNEPTSQTLGYSLSSNETGDLCMICGGDVYLHFHVLEPTDTNIALFDTLADAALSDNDSWLLLKIADGAPTELSLARNGDVSDEIRALLRRVPVYDKDGTGIYALPLSRSGHVYIFGGGHVAQQLVPALTRVDFSCIVYEDRPDFAAPELFDGAAGTICADFKDVLSHVKFVPSDYVVVLTRGHKDDYAVLAQTLPTSAGYVGCIGSRRKMAIIRERLRDEAGIDPETVARLHSPIGIEIEAETPAEIAVSIAAEMIRIRATGR